MNIYSTITIFLCLFPACRWVRPPKRNAGCFFAAVLFSLRPLDESAVVEPGEDPSESVVTFGFLGSEGVGEGVGEGDPNISADLGGSDRLRTWAGVSSQAQPKHVVKLQSTADPLMEKREPKSNVNF